MISRLRLILPWLIGGIAFAGPGTFPVPTKTDEEFLAFAAANG
jgi:hypothetical protein